jgi:DNA mismatch endonuclease (patch repair protein)
MDTLTVAERSERMARIRSKDTKPEWVVRRIAHALGFRYRLHVRGLPGSPDLTFKSRKKVIFVHGCFWHAHHGCKTANRPKSRRPYWDEKFRRNVERDAINERALRQNGWGVLTIWECETKKVARLGTRIASFLGLDKNHSSKGGSRNGRK